MPTYNRRTLRQSLGQSFLNDTLLSTTTQTLSPGAGSGAFVNSTAFADTSLTNQNLYENATIEHHATGAASGNDYDYRVSSFNAGSGAFITSQIIQATVNFGDSFEVHSRLPPAQKDLAIDDTIKRIRVRQEVGIMTGTAGLEFYSIEGAASPHYISDVLDAYYFTSPQGSISRYAGHFSDFRIVTTATGREIRIAPWIAGSQQIVLDAILELTLGVSDFATINIPDDRWVLSGAAAKSYDLLIMQSPGQAAGELRTRQAVWAGEFTRLSGRFAPNYAKKIRLGEPWE